MLEEREITKKICNKLWEKYDPKKIEPSNYKYFGKAMWEDTVEQYKKCMRHFKRNYKNKLIKISYVVLSQEQENFINLDENYFRLITCDYIHPSAARRSLENIRKKYGITDEMLKDIYENVFNYTCNKELRTPLVIKREINKLINILNESEGIISENILQKYRKNLTELEKEYKLAKKND